jgi:hypothetical protein
MTRGALVFVMLVLAVGCSKKPLTEVDIEGKALDRSGKPVQGYVVRFHPDEESIKHARTVTCVVQTDGKFVGRCLPGKYKVTLAKIGSAGTADPSAGGVVAPEKGGITVGQNYLSPTATPWVESIPADGKKDIELKIK